MYNSSKNDFYEISKKVLFKLGNITLLDWVYLRVVKTKLIDEVVIATTNEKEDDLILEHCKINNYKCFRGDKLNVLKRFYNCTIQHSGEIIVRITADDPFKDEKLISFAIKELVDKNLDYFSNTIYQHTLKDLMLKCLLKIHCLKHLRVQKNHLSLNM